MQQLRYIATYSRRLGAPQNIRRHKSPPLQYAATRHVLFMTAARKQASTTTALIPDGKTDSIASRG